MRTVRAALHRGSAPRLVLTLLGALAIIAGILGMHVLAADMGGHNMTGAAAVMEAPASMAMPEAAAPTASTSRAAISTEAMHDGMVLCTLALLSVLLLIAVPGILGRLRLTVRAGYALSDVLAVLAVPRPPSLTALSISRT